MFTCITAVLQIILVLLQQTRIVHVPLLAASWSWFPVKVITAYRVN